jgi:tryptophanyl-tRNA synthetase
MGNDIELALSDEETLARVMEAVTDPARRYRDDPGHPEVCNVFRLHGYFSPFAQEELSENCRAAKIGCVDCKQKLTQEINATLKAFRERRAALAAKPQYVKDVLNDGASRARVIARETMREVKQRIGLL